MFSGARISIQGFAAWAGAASRANVRAARASRRIAATLSAQRSASGVQVGEGLHAHDLAVLEPDSHRGVLLDLDPAGGPATGEGQADEHRLTLVEELERLEPHVVDKPVEALEVAARAGVPLVGVRLGGQLARDLDREALRDQLEREVDPAAAHPLQQLLDDLDVRCAHWAPHVSG